MPELPEVETARRNIGRDVVGRRLDAVTVRLPKLLRDSPIPDPGVLVGRELLAAHRRAKLLWLDFSDGLSLMMHLKLAGQIAIFRPDGTRAVAGHPVPAPAGPYPHKVTHADLLFTGGTLVHYSDVRQFGWWRIMPTEDIAGTVAGFGFGPEAVGDATVTGPWLRERFARRGVPVKTVLLDQRVLAGLGNIYVDEALHAAGIHPARPAASLAGPELDRLAETIPGSLAWGIAQGGAKIIHQRAYPVDGFPAVHAREGEPCPACGTAITKTRVGGRGTYLCPTCQPGAPAVPAIGPSRESGDEISGKPGDRQAG